MKTHLTHSLLVLLLIARTACAEPGTTEPFAPGKVQSSPIPDELNDPETHLRVLHLSRFPTDYAGVVYFTYNPFSSDSRLALIDAQYKAKWRYLYTFDLGANTVTPLVTDHLTQNQVVVASSGNLYYQTDTAAWVVPLKGGTPRKLCDLPGDWAPGIGFTVNADETLLLGGGNDVGNPDAPHKAVDPLTRPRVLYTVNLKTGEVKVIHRDNCEFGHVQFSPTDPDLCMFCHEGNWEAVDRIWFINPSKSVTAADGTVTSNARIAYKRTEAREIVGHEFWQPDGKLIWFQQSYRAHPDRGGFLTSMDVATGKATPYKIPAGFAGIHETFSPDGTFLVSDGSAPKGENHGPGKYLSKLTLPVDGSNILKGEHLVTMQDNDYAVEPNPHVSPDNHWVIFTATLHGTAQAYAVEMPGNNNTPK